MNLSVYSKKLALPPGFVPPHELRYKDLVARAITRDDVAEDVIGINESLDLIRKTRGGSWPQEAVTETEIIVDEYWHECEFRNRTSFAFIVRDLDNNYLGCAYLYPLGVRQQLTRELADNDVDVSWWVTPPAHNAGYYTMTYEALQHWSTHDFPFQRAHFSNTLIPII